MNLFQLGDFKLHSGESTKWKIDCDALTDADIEALAFMASERLMRFGSVAAVPTGGNRLAEAMKRFADSTRPAVLIVDDVLTTGASMNAMRSVFNERGTGVFGLVLFARGVCPSWITPLFQMPPSAWHGR